MHLHAEFGSLETKQLGLNLDLKETQTYTIERSSELFAWTLSHTIVPFSNVDPKFNDIEELHAFVARRYSDDVALEGFNRFKSMFFGISILAHEKMNREWTKWVQVHQDSHFDEIRLDNMLMRILYRFVLNRDGNQCVLCSKCLDLTIHHIVRKQRNVSPRIPPFGRSVPTNLVTLCRDCHSKFEPYISSSFDNGLRMNSRASDKCSWA